MNISKYVAQLYDTPDTIVVFGNFAMFKKGTSLPAHAINTLDRAGMVAFFMREGEWKDLGEISGYQVHEVSAGTGKIYVCTNGSEIRFILGI